MAQITITIPDIIITRVLDAFAFSYGWQGAEAKSIFTRRKIMEYIKEVTVSYERKIAVESSGTRAEEKAKSEIELT